jgi:hypothetical protein
VVNLTSFILLHHSCAHFPDHFHHNLADGEPLAVVADQLVDEGVLRGNRFALLIFVGSAGSVGSIQLLRSE